MPYNNYFPTNYQPLYMPQTQLQAVTPQAAQQNNGLVWVQGETGAKAHLVAPNTTVMLMDSEKDQFFLKSADASGMPLPLRTFKYEEIKNQPISATQNAPSTNNTEYVEKSVYEDFKRHIEDVLSGLTDKQTKKKVDKDE